MNFHVVFFICSKLDADNSWEFTDSVSFSFIEIHDLHDFNEILIFDEFMLFFRYLIFEELQAWFQDNLLRDWWAGTFFELNNSILSHWFNVWIWLIFAENEDKSSVTW